MPYSCGDSVLGQALMAQPAVRLFVHSCNIRPSAVMRISCSLLLHTWPLAWNNVGASLSGNAEDGTQDHAAVRSVWPNTALHAYSCRALTQLAIPAHNFNRV